MIVPIAEIDPVAFINLMITLVIIVAVLVAAIASVKAVNRLRKPVEIHLGRFIGSEWTTMKVIQVTLFTRQSVVIVSKLGYIFRDRAKKTHVSEIEPGMCIAGWRKDGEMSYPIDLWLDMDRRLLIKSEEIKKQCASLGLEAPVRIVVFAELRGLPTCYSNEAEFDPEKLEKAEA